MELHGWKGLGRNEEGMLRARVVLVNTLRISSDHFQVCPSAMILEIPFMFLIIGLCACMQVCMCVGAEGEGSSV